MAVPRPTREVAGTRVPKRGEYQPSIGSTSARWMVQASRVRKQKPPLSMIWPNLPGKRRTRSVEFDHDVRAEVPRQPQWNSRSDVDGVDDYELAPG